MKLGACRAIGCQWAPMTGAVRGFRCIRCGRVKPAVRS